MTAKTLSNSNILEIQEANSANQPKACRLPVYTPSSSYPHNLYAVSLLTHLPSLCSRTAQQMVKSLKKAMAPVLSDVTVEWIFPEATEVLISPVSTGTLFPGERLVGYGIVCDASLYVSNPRSVSILEIPGASGVQNPCPQTILSRNSNRDI